MGQLAVRRLVKRFGEHVVVNDVSFEVEDGEFFVLLGPSGGGKSTLLQLLCGLELPDSGTIALNGRDITSLPPRQRNLGMVFQNYGLYPNMNVFDNVAYGLQARNMDKSEINRRIGSAAATLGLSDKLSLPVVDLSGGEQQRVALARALVKDADAYLYDEPLANLDPKLRFTARRDILRVHREKQKPSVYITHDQNEAFALADRIAIIGPGGTLHQVGRGDDLTTQPANTFVAGFIGSPAMNLLPATLQRRGGVLTALGDGFELPLPPHLDRAAASHADAKVVLGIRPDGFRAVRHTETSTLHAEILELEPLMGETELRLRIGDHRKIMALIADDTGLAFEAGAQLELSCDDGALHLFDATSGTALRPTR